MPLARQLRILYVGCLDGLLAERKPEPPPGTRGGEGPARRVQPASLPFTRVEARPVGTGRVRHFRTHCSKQGLQPPPHAAQQARRGDREVAVRTHPPPPTLAAPRPSPTPAPNHGLHPPPHPPKRPRRV